MHSVCHSAWPRRVNVLGFSGSRTCPPVPCLLILLFWTFTSYTSVRSYNTYFCSVSSTLWWSLFLSVTKRVNLCPSTVMLTVFPALCYDAGDIWVVLFSTFPPCIWKRKTKWWGQTEHPQGRGNRWGPVVLCIWCGCLKICCSLRVSLYRLLSTVFFSFTAINIYSKIIVIKIVIVAWN